MNNKHQNNEQSLDNTLQNKFTAYVKKALINNRNKYLAKQHKRETIELPYDFTEIEMGDTDMATASVSEIDINLDMIDNLRLFEAIRHISREDMMIIKLHVLYGLTYKSIANSMGVTEAVVSSRYFRAIKKMRKHMEE